MDKKIKLNENTTLEEMHEIIKDHTYAAKVTYENIENEDLAMACDVITKKYSEAFKKQRKLYNTDRIINKIFMKIPDAFVGKEPRIIYDEAITNVINNIDYERAEVKDIKRYLKHAKKYSFYDDMPLAYCTLVGIGKMHVELNDYLQMETDLLSTRLNKVGYIPAKRYELPSEEYKETISIAIDRLYGMNIPAFELGNNGKQKVKE